MNAKSERLAPYFTQAAYFVPDIASVREWFQRVLRIEYPEARQVVQGAMCNLRVREKPVSTDLRIMLAIARAGFDGQQEIELIQPERGENIFWEIFEQCGPGLNHVAFSVPDYDAATARLRAAGIQVLKEQKSPGVRSAYFDCRSVGASIIEILHHDERGATMIDQFKGSATWRVPPPIRSASAQPQGDALAQGLAPYLFQVSYVVRDLAAAHQWFNRVLGVNFGVGEFDLGDGYNLRYRGKPTSADHKIKVAIGRAGLEGEQEIELVEPQPGNNLYWEFLEEHGPGLHHIAFLVPDFESAAAPFRSAGIQPLMETERDFHTAYFDCRPAGASVIEISEYDEATASFMEEFKGPRPHG